MKLVILSDIWGVDLTLTQWLKTVLGNCSFELLSPYLHLSAEQLPKFNDDQQAYAFFTMQGGLDRYTQVTKQWLATQHEPVVLIGFSAGAAVAYQLACEDLPLKAILGVYGGQIHRLHKVFSPNRLKCATTLIFSDEDHFDVPTLVETLGRHPLVDAFHWPYPHGFANHRSNGFNETALIQLSEFIIEWMQSHLVV